MDRLLQVKTRAVGGRRNPSAYVVVGTPLPFDFFLERTSKSPFCHFLPKICEFQKNVLSSSSLTYQQLTNQKSWWSMKKCTLHCENTDFAKNAQFRLLILPFFTLKMRILKNRSIFLFPHLPTTHKPKIVMIHQEMRPVMRKNWKVNEEGQTDGGNSS